jgi:hypothetical protein
MLGVGSHQRSGPTPLRDVISIYQRLKSGTEFDQLGVKGLGGRGDRKGSSSDGAAAGCNGQ